MQLKRRSLSNNYFFNLLYSVLSIFIPIITTPYITRVLNASKIGDFNYTSSIETYFALFAVLGTTAYARREIAANQNNAVQRRVLFKEIVLLRFILVTISSVAYFVMSFLSVEYTLLYLVQFIALLSVAFDISWYFQGMEDFQSIAIRDMVVRLLSIILIFCFVKTENDVWVYALINSCSTFASAIYMWKFIDKETIRTKISLARIFLHILPSLKLFVPIVAINVYTALDKVMLKVLCDSSEVGYYSLSERIVKLVLTVITALGTVLQPRIAALYAEHKDNEIRNQLEVSITFVLSLAIPLVFGTIAVSSILVPVFLGDGYEESIPLLKVLSILFIFIGMSGSVGGPLLVPLKRENQYSISVIAGACTNGVLNYLLIPKFQAIGASVATIAAEGIVMSLSIYFCRDFISLKQTIGSVLKYTIYSVIMFIPLLLEKYFLCGEVGTLFIMIITGISVYFGLLIMTKDKMAGLLKKLIIDKIRK